jgi:hypothetical protein
MVFIFYAFAIIIMLIARPLIAQKFLPKKGKFSVYAALYFFPILALLHAIGSGLICKYLNFKNILLLYNYKIIIHLFRLLFSIYYDYFVSSFKCCTFCIQIESGKKYLILTKEISI